MSLSVIEIYRDILPKTNCKECGHPTCLAFASAVVLEKFPLSACPYIEPDVLARSQTILEEQHQEGKFLKRDLAEDALEWARKRSTSMRIEDLPDRIGGELKGSDDAFLDLPYFSGKIHIHTGGEITYPDGRPLDRWEQVFILNHMAQGGRSLSTGVWKGFEEIPNTTSKMKSMREHVEVPLITRFRGRPKELIEAAKKLGAQVLDPDSFAADVVVSLVPLPRIPVMILFRDEDQSEGFGAEVKLLFDETITEHLDIESIMFLSERLKNLLVG
jgi:hypothetical protein